MNNKGFTLIELVGVIVILAILGVVTFPIISGILNKNAERLDANQKKMIISAAKNYAMKNAFKKVECVSVSTLKKEGLLDDLNIESHSEDADYNNYIVIIKHNGSKYEYTPAQIKDISDKDRCD